MRKIKYLLLIFAILFIGIRSVYAVDPSEKVYDFANVLTPDEEAKLKFEIDKFITEYDMDMAIVTVKYHNYSTTEEYADDFYDYNSFGFNVHKDGLVCVLDFSSLHKNVGFHISTSGQAMIVYDDARLNNILDAMVAEYDKDSNNYYNILNAFVTNATYYASKGIPKSNQNVRLNDEGMPYEVRPFPWAIISILSFLIPTTVVFVLIKRNKMVHKSTNADQYIDNDSINITAKKDQFLTTATTRVRISSPSTGSGSGRAGGTSFHHSSGGFHGGAGRSR